MAPPIWLFCSAIGGSVHRRLTDAGWRALRRPTGQYAPTHCSSPACRPAHSVAGTLYGLLDGAICGAIFAWLYNHFAAAQPTNPTPA